MRFTRGDEEHPDCVIERSVEYDAYFCADHDEWLEAPCPDPECDICGLDRPLYPSRCKTLVVD